MTHTEILFRIAKKKDTLLGQCAAVWYQNRKVDKNGKIYVLECNEMCEMDWVRKLLGKELVNDIRNYAKNYRGQRNFNSTKLLVIGSSIKKIRKRKGIKQTSLAIATGLLQGSLSKIERSNSFLPSRTVAKIASELKVSSKRIVKSV